MSSVVVNRQTCERILSRFDHEVYLQKMKMKEDLIVYLIRTTWKNLTREEAIKSLSPTGEYDSWIISDSFVMEYERKFAEQLRCLLRLGTKEITVDGETAVALRKFLV